jgi:hypothetical protein
MPAWLVPHFMAQVFGSMPCPVHSMPHTQTSSAAQASTASQHISFMHSMQGSPSPSSHTEPPVEPAVESTDVPVAELSLAPSPLESADVVSADVAVVVWVPSVVEAVVLAELLALLVEAVVDALVSLPLSPVPPLASVAVPPPSSPAQPAGAKVVKMRRGRRDRNRVAMPRS